MRLNIFYDDTEQLPDPPCNTSLLFPAWNVPLKSLLLEVAFHDSTHWSMLSAEIYEDEPSPHWLFFQFFL